MKLFAPKYYNDFKCIAEKCAHSCCIGWEIDIDRRTLKKYLMLKDSYGKRIAESIEGDENPHFRLTDGERCTHLDGNGLCRIINELGEGYLCDICREHPRFYNVTANGREVGLGLACEEACRIILSSDEYEEIVPIGTCRGVERTEFNVLPYRKRAYSVIGDRSV